jgi:hypothetical protein
MRTLTLVLLGILASGCASRAVDVKEQFIDCDDTSDVSVSLALNVPGVGMETAVDEQLMAVVGVDNNMDVDVEVVAIRIDPGQSPHPRYRITNSYREFKRTLPARGDADFELPVSGRSLASGTLTSRTLSDTIPIIVSVYLGNGTTYRCEYDVAAPKI